MTRPITKADWPAVKNIYKEGILTGHATFQCASTIPDYEAWLSSKISQSTFVYEKENDILGWASLSPVSSRCVYAGVAEVSVYISAKARGQGLGQLLLGALVQYAEEHNIWTLQAGIFPENIASVKLHEKLGFRIVGLREKIGQLDGQWRDNYLLERRSSTIF